MSKREMEEEVELPHQRAQLVSVLCALSINIEALVWRPKVANPAGFPQTLQELYENGSSH